MNKYLYFAVSATDQYIVPLSRLLGADDTGSSKVVLHFEDLNGSTAKNGDITKVVLSVNAGKEKEALRDLFEGIANFRGEVITVADSANSSFFGVNITACDSITHDQTSASSGLTLGGDLTISAAQDVDLVDNSASALSFDTTGKSGIMNIVTTNSAEGVTMSGTLDVAGELEYTAVSNETVDAGNGGGSATALSVTKQVSFVSTATSKSHVSLADGTIGQIKYIVHKALANTTSLVITPANLNGSSTLTSDAAGRVVALMFDGTNWNIMGDIAEFAVA